MKLSANDVQNTLGVQDLQVIACGYTFERKLVELFFEKGQLVRRVDGVDEWSDVLFSSAMFQQNIKRWYTSSVHPYLLVMFSTFSEYGLPLTSGGPEWGYFIGSQRKED